MGYEIDMEDYKLYPWLKGVRHDIMEKERANQVLLLDQKKSTQQKNLEQDYDDPKLITDVINNIHEELSQHFKQIKEVENANFRQNILYASNTNSRITSLESQINSLKQEILELLKYKKDLMHLHRQNITEADITTNE